MFFFLSRKSKQIIENSWKTPNKILRVVSVVYLHHQSRLCRRLSHWAGGSHQPDVCLPNQKHPPFRRKRTRTDSVSQFFLAF